MRLCCDPLGRWLENAGKRGVSIAIKKFPSGPRFVLQSRSVDADKVIALQKASLARVASSLKIHIVSQEVIHFCPFCGASSDTVLSGLDTSMRDELIRLHSEYVIVH
jgi:hypothetical protein